MTTSPAVKALRYAEDQLGVNLVYEDAIKQRDFLDGLMNDLSLKRDSKRALEAKIQDREYEIMSDERGKHPEMSAAAMDKHLKIAYHEDSTHQQLRAEHMSVVNDLDGLELDRSVLELDIKIAVARLTELGGYFQYLAVIKAQATSTYDTSETSKT